MQGKDFIFKQTPAGTSVSLNPRWKHAYDSFYKSEFDPSASYVSGDIVRVLIDTDYTSRDGTLLTGISPGVWVCQKNIPPDVDPSTISSWPVALQADFSRNAGISYYPTWPEPDNGGFKYWELIGMLPIQISFCTDGVETQGWIAWMPISGNSSP